MRGRRCREALNSNVVRLSIVILRSRSLGPKDLCNLRGRKTARSSCRGPSARKRRVPQDDKWVRVARLRSRFCHLNPAGIYFNVALNLHLNRGPHVQLKFRAMLKQRPRDPCC